MSVLVGCLGCASPQKSVFSIAESDRSIYARLIAEPDCVSYFTSFDLTRLAYREVLPDTFGAILAFIHGTAAQSKLYLPLADTLRKNGIATALLDLRGHGLSEGERGDAKNATALARDVKLFLDTLRAKHPNKKIILGGHSLGAGACLKYLSFFHDRKNLYRPPDALILMSGGFYPNPNCNERKPKRDGAFARVDAAKSLLLIPDMLLDLHPKAFEILLPQDSLAQVAVSKNLLVTRYALTFFLAAFPIDAMEAYRLARFPTLLVIGKNDELMRVCDAEFAFKRIATREKKLLVCDANHIDVIWRSAPDVANWINSLQP
ncbi:MAG: lysophospholipase [Chloroherpetonaceae bacterium]|nr:lysophospholipase [Chloroherpetonaceae bacterium]